MLKTDNELVGDFLAGNEESLELLFERYFKVIYNFTYRFVHEPDVASDITQETFVKAWRNLKKFDQNLNFKTWLFTIAKNTAYDWLKKKKPIVFSTLTATDEDDHRLENLVVDTEPWPDEVFAQKEIKTKLGEQLSKIPPLDQTIILLHLQEGQTFEMVAEILDQPMNTIKSRYRRALIKLRDLLGSSELQN
ncbi:MAG: sigma-70 family RNA polymerase sigma factor [Candidatus Vogelbacteria bacterium]|nr:sigma-70 family RNA polymerase sigma factor [Candidatus Vogelbacteria bacterium]